MQFENWRSVDVFYPWKNVAKEEQSLRSLSKVSHWLKKKCWFLMRKTKETFGKKAKKEKNEMK